jgi:AraC-like DNA-binding protein
MAGRYIEAEPHPRLRAWIRRVWTFEDVTPGPGIQLIPPDGCPELVVHLATPYEEEVDGLFVRQSRVVFAGQMTRPIRLRSAGPVCCAALRFEPDAAFYWFGAAMSEATDRRIDVTQRLGIDPGANLGDCLDRMQDQVAAVVETAGGPPDRAVREEVRRLEEGHQSAPRDAAERRRLQRRFLRQVGVSPQVLRSVFRFRKVFDRALAPDAGNWLTVALDSGYFDQPQMARDFRRFLGCTAMQWARERAGIGHAIAARRSPGGASEASPTRQAD